MALRIFTNLSSLNSQRVLDINNNQLGRSISRIASGIRIQTASDDAAGLAITESIRADTRTLKQGVRNLNDGIAMINTAEGAMSEQSSILIRLREIASQAATGTIGQVERQTIDLEFASLRTELDRIAQTTEFNGQRLLDGSLAASVPTANQLIIQMGTSSATNNRVNLNQELDLTAATSSELGFSFSTVANVPGALASMDALTLAIEDLITVRARVGAVQQGLGRTLSNVSIQIENLTAAVSTIRDADLAAEIAELTKNQILVQSGAAMVSQSNLNPQAVLSLLGS